MHAWKSHFCDPYELKKDICHITPETTDGLGTS